MERLGRGRVALGYDYANRDSPIGSNRGDYREISMMFLAAQGDVLIEKVPDDNGRPCRDESLAISTVVIASGEASGHAHRLQGSLYLFRDEALARDVPANLYVAHACVRSPGAKLVHEEHAPIDLPEGTYRFRLQRRLDPMDSDFSDPYGLAGD